MNRKKVSIAAVSMAVAFLAATCVTANSQTSNTPLYTFRMEQASSEMSFLPTAVNEFTYNTRDGFTLNYEFATDSDVARAPLMLGPTWWGETCEDPFCWYLLTSYQTCPDTCRTCYTCLHTCPYTCKFTCLGHTWWRMCETCGMVYRGCFG